jgi:hypothetical protein
VLLHFTCHPVHGYPHRYVSADWPGAWADGMRAFCGPGCVPLTLNGCCGNIHHRNHLDADQVDTYQLMGQALTETAITAIKRELTQVAEPRLAWKTVHLKLPYRDIQVELQQAREFLKQHPEPMWQDDQHIQCSWDWMAAVTYVALQERREHDGGLFDCVLQALRIGEIALVSFPGEPFVEAQLRLKVESPTYPTYTAHMSMYDPCYIPTRHAFARGGYETEWGDLRPEALDAIADGALQAVRDIFK